VTGTWSFAAVGPNTFSAGTASFDVVLPSNRGSAMLAMVLCRSEDDIVTATPGWTRLAQAKTGALFSGAIFAADDPATAAAPTFTGVDLVNAQIVAYGPFADIADAPPHTGTATANARVAQTTKSVDGFSSTQANSGAIYFIAGDTTGSFNPRPAGWLEDVDGASGSAATGWNWGSKNLGAAGSASGTISVAGSFNDSVAFQIELLTAPPTPGATVAVLESAPFVGPGSGASVAILESAPWLRSVVGVEIAMLESVAWIIPSGRAKRRQLFMN